MIMNSAGSAPDPRGWTVPEVGRPTPRAQQTHRGPGKNHRRKGRVVVALRAIVDLYPVSVSVFHDPVAQVTDIRLDHDRRWAMKIEYENPYVPGVFVHFI